MVHHFTIYGTILRKMMYHISFFEVWHIVFFWMKYFFFWKYLSGARRGHVPYGTTHHSISQIFTIMYIRTHCGARRVPEIFHQSFQQYRHLFTCFLQEGSKHTLDVFPHFFWKKNVVYTGEKIISFFFCFLRNQCLKIKL